jgi:cell division septation protein DedD
LRGYLLANQEKKPKGRPKTRPKKAKTRAPKTPFSRGAWIFLIVLSSTWMFILGVLVGRGTSPLRFDLDRIEAKLQSYVSAAMEKEEQQSRDLIEELKDPIKSGHLGELGGKKVAKAAPSKAKASQKPAAKPQASKAEPPVTRPPEKKSAETPAPPPEPVADEPDKDAEPRFTVQVSSIKDANAAAQMVLRLKRKGYPAFMKPVRVQGVGVTYRVMVGDFKSRTSADYLNKRLKKDNIDGMVRSR